MNIQEWSFRSWCWKTACIGRVEPVTGSDLDRSSKCTPCITHKFAALFPCSGRTPIGLFPVCRSVLVPSLPNLNIWYWLQSAACSGFVASTFPTEPRCPSQRGRVLQNRSFPGSHYWSVLYYHRQIWVHNSWDERTLSLEEMESTWVHSMCLKCHYHLP